MVNGLSRIKIDQGLMDFVIKSLLGKIFLAVRVRLQRMGRIRVSMEDVYYYIIYYREKGVLCKCLIIGDLVYYGVNILYFFLQYYVIIIMK